MPNRKKPLLIRGKQDRELAQTFTVRQREFYTLRALVEQGQALDRYLDNLPNQRLEVINLDLGPLYTELCKVLPVLERGNATYQDYFAKLADFLNHGALGSSDIEHLPE